MDIWRNCKVRNIDETYKTELNFVDEFNLSRNGMIKEISYISFVGICNYYWINGSICIYKIYY